MAAQSPLPERGAIAVADLCEAYLRPVAGMTGYPGPTRTLVFVPELDAAEQAAYDDLVAMARMRITGLSLAEYQALKPTLQGLGTYRDLASPTAAQTVQAVKGIIDVLRALVTG